MSLNQNDQGQLLVTDPNAVGSTAVNQKTAFGEELVANLTPEIQLQFPYNINAILIDSTSNGGSVSSVNNMAKLSTGASANRIAHLISKDLIKYNPGQGGLWRGTAVFTAGAANSTQIIGIGEPFDGYFFGFNGATFGVQRKQGGKPEIQTLTITAGAVTDAGNITITLDGDAKVVAVANADTVDEVVDKIVATSFDSVGDGWLLHKIGVTGGSSTISFCSRSPGDKSGTFSFVDTDTTGVAATFAETLAGASTTTTVVNQSSWNQDTFDGTGDSGVTLDPTKGNVYQIRYQWLGFGAIEFSIENPETGVFTIVHRIKYANTVTIPSVDNPTFSLFAGVENTSNTSDIVMYSGSMAGFTEGKEELLGIRRGVSANTAGVTTTEKHLISIRNKIIYQSLVNRVKVKVNILSGSSAFSAGNGEVTLRFYANPILTAAVWTDVSTNTSVVQKDTSATGINVAGAAELFAMTLSDKSSQIIDLTSDIHAGHLNPGNIISVTGETSQGTTEIDIALNFIEFF
tara:strand:+ start:113064 stop:114614 length:1551 start_codon:yes stop_codon:yes gene_type:complete